MDDSHLNDGVSACEGFELQQVLDRLVHTALEDSNGDDYLQLAQLVGGLVSQVSSTQPDNATIGQFCCVLSAISSNAAKVDEDEHEDLLRQLFKLSLWRVPQAVQAAWADLIVHLTWVRISLQDTCIQFLVRTFSPPIGTGVAVAGSEARELHIPTTQEVATHACALDTLNKIITQQPLCSKIVKDALVQNLPHPYWPRERQSPFFRALFKLAEMPAGQLLWDSVFTAAVGRLVDIDAEIRWEGIVEQLCGQEEEDGSESDDLDDDDLRNAAALFQGGMELGGESDDEGGHGDGRRHAAAPPTAAVLLGTAEDTQLGFEGHARRCRSASGHTQDEEGPTSSLALAHKLDPLMAMLFEHMRARAKADGTRLWRDCLQTFDTILLGSQRIKFTPFVMFLGAYLAGLDNAQRFLEELVSRVCDPGEAKTRRITCAAYAGSFMARFDLLPLADVVTSVERLAQFAAEYAAQTTSAPGTIHRSASSAAPFSNGSRRSSSVQRSVSAASVPALQDHEAARHDIFYATCQALMYTVCFHSEALSHGPGDEGKAGGAEARAAFQSVVCRRVVPLMRCHLNPLQACLPTVSAEFARTSCRHGLGDLAYMPPSVESRRKVRCDTYFPFDPYLLPLSAPALQLQGYYRCWRHGHAVASDVASAHTALADLDDGPHGRAASDEEPSDHGEDDGSSDDGDDRSASAGRSLDMLHSLPSPSPAGSSPLQAAFVNPFASTMASQRHPGSVMCPVPERADASMGVSPRSDDSGAYGDLRASPTADGFAPMSFTSGLHPGAVTKSGFSFVSSSELAQNECTAA